MKDFSKPFSIYGYDTMALLPSWEEIPDTFKDSKNPFVRWQQRWFFEGLYIMPMMKEGIDLNKAMAHLSMIQTSYTPQHEHKQAAVAYLASLWFEEV